MLRVLCTKRRREDVPDSMRAGKSFPQAPDAQKIAAEPLLPSEGRWLTAARCDQLPPDSRPAVPAPTRPFRLRRGRAGLHGSAERASQMPRIHGRPAAKYAECCSTGIARKKPPAHPQINRTAPRAFLRIYTTEQHRRRSLQACRAMVRMHHRCEADREPHAKQLHQR